MAASTVNDANFSEYRMSAPTPTSFPLPFSVTVPTTSLDDVNDRYNIASVAAGKRIVAVDIHSNGAGDAHATPTLDADIVLSEVGLASADGTETILVNAGTRFQAANTVFLRTTVDETIADSTDSKGVVRLLVNTAAATAAQMTLSGVIWVE